MSRFWYAAMEAQCLSLSRIPTRTGWLPRSRKSVAVLLLGLGLMIALLKRVQATKARHFDKPVSMDSAFRSLIKEALEPYDEKLETLKEKISDNRRDSDNRLNHIDNQLSEIRSRLQ